MHLVVQNCRYTSVLISCLSFLGFHPSLLSAALRILGQRGASAEFVHRRKAYGPCYSPTIVSFGQALAPQRNFLSYQIPCQAVESPILY